MPGKNSFSSMNKEGKGKRIFEVIHCPFQVQANMRHQIQPGGTLFLGRNLFVGIEMISPRVNNITRSISVLFMF